ncbi:MAG TPA: serine hydrolase domain-containing protein [Pirellulales bacterium]|nr:serine hydrolase domain-containing protein [Pirellulales bacterium]
MRAFMAEHQPPGAALAVARSGRLVYARGFGYADRERRVPVEPNALFRIASLSKSLTSAAIFRLVEMKRLRLDEKVFELLKIEPHLERGAKVDPRLREVTVLQCLQHTGGWDRDKTYDPMGARGTERAAAALKLALPIEPRDLLRFTFGRPLDFDPGTKFVYSNFGYCVLGRVIEAASGKKYDDFVRSKLLAPLRAQRIQLGKNLLADRAPGEVKYYDSQQRTGRAISGPAIGQPAPLPYGVEPIETMDANGGWIASAVDLLRFISSLDDLKTCPILAESSLRALLAPPPGPVGHLANDQPKPQFYGCGWQVRPAPHRDDQYTKWHTGLVSGTSTLMVCRDDDIDWVVLFNSDADTKGQQFAALIDPLLHGPADKIRAWPKIDLFEKLLKQP